MKNKRRLLLALICIIAVLIPACVFADSGSLIYTGPAITDGADPQVSEDGKYVWYGSYPQIEIVDKAETSGVNGNSWATEKDYVVDGSLYSKLQNATNFDSYDDVIIDGVKYHRIRKRNATYSSSDSSYYNWSDADTYHYFRYDPIKWRILETIGNDAFLLADVSLDDQKYNKSYSSITWEKSPVRSWLNQDFLNRAFTTAEKSAIKTTSVENKDNLNYKTEGGDNTQDKVFLLSESEVYGDEAVTYGFASNSGTYDKARQAKSSTYAKAMGAYSSTDSSYLGNNYWWLRSPGNSTDYAAYVYTYGYVNGYGDDVGSSNNGIRPALHLNLKSSSSLSKDITADNVKLSESKIDFDGTAKTPTVKVTGLVKDTDYTVSYADNIDVGTATVTITGKGNWAGTITRNFNITFDQETTGKLTRDVKYDCIYFGSYPQTEIVYDKSASGVNGKSWATEADYDVDANLYSKLMNASFNSSGDTTISGVKYHRIKKGNATYSSSSSAYYNWSDADTYHYFRYDPIKWRILETSGNDAFLLADVSLDDQKYNKEWESVTWETSTVRNWLNQDFLNRAFTAAEKSAIKTTSVENKDNLNYKTEGGNDTQDKVFLLSESEVYGDEAVTYGFDSDYDEYDKARQAKSSTYAKAMGVWSDTGSGDLGNNSWWLRSPGGDTTYAACVYNYGSDYIYGNYVNYNKYGIRPALHLNLQSSGAYERTDSTDTIKIMTIASAHTEQERYPYLGQAVEPEVVVPGLKKDIDYTVSYSNNDQIGVATATITGINRYSGTITLKYAIVSSINISGMEANLDANTYYFNGSPVKPTVTIAGLTAGRDFTVAYQDNNKAGIGKLIITGNPVNGYSGEIVKNFMIKPMADQVAEQIKDLPDAKSVTLSNKADVVAARIAYDNLTSSQKSMVDASKLLAAEAQIKKLEQVAATKKAQADFAKKSTSITKLKALKKKTIQVTWKTVSGVGGYQVQYALKKNFKSAKTATFKKAATKAGKIKKLKAKKKYYVRVRMYKSIGGKTIYSKWSSIKSVKTKK